VALSQDQKKHLLIGGGVGALALLLGSKIFGHKGHAASAHGALQASEPHKKHRKKHRQSEQDSEGDNDRGEYGRKKHHKEHGDG
jgi:hypothetical protein